MARKDSRQAQVEKKARKAAKRERRERQRQTESHPSYALVSGLAEAEQLLDDGDFDEASEVLEELARRYPKRVEILEMLLDAYLEQSDMWAYQSTCQRLLALDPNAADLWLGLAGAALANGQFATAYRAFNHIIDHWPDREGANDARNMLANLESILREEAAQYGMEERDSTDLLLLHDEIQLHLHQGKYERVIEVADQMLSRCPIFAPALNNRGEAQFRSGHLELAIADARRVLEFSPGNFHALANLTRYLFLIGQFDEARVTAEQLKSAQSESPDLFVKQAEALAMLGDWQGILTVLDRADKRKIDARSTDLGLLYHLAGVAAAELEKLDLARRNWKRAVKMNAAADWAQENLDDLKAPPGEQSGPWTFPMEYWIPRAMLDRYIAELERGEKMSRRGAHRQGHKLFELYPHIETQIPSLLHHADPIAKEFAVRLASQCDLPPVQSALREFAFGRRGTDQLRYSAAMGLLDAGAIEAGEYPMWVNGEQVEIRLMTVEITTEPTRPLPKDVQSLANRAWEAIHNGDGAAAESLLEQALERRPDDPLLAFNRSVAMEMQGRHAEAMAIVREVHGRHPDYLFARIKLAEEQIERRNFEAARELLNPLLARRHFHQSEYTAMCRANIELCVAQKERTSAQRWLMMWENVAPDDERVMYWRARLKPGLLGKLLK